MSRLALLALLALAGCGYPYTPPALAPVTSPGPAATPTATPADVQPAPPAAPPTPTPAATVTADARTPVTILVSIDAFRADYLNRGITPRLSALAASGVSAAMRPSFPSKTFPNHWTLVTGLYPDHTGIVANNMDDPTIPGPPFTMQTDDPRWWSAAPPLWVTAEQAGIRTATMFWPGSNVAWGGTPTGHHGAVDGGIRPEDWQQFNSAVTGDQRVDAVIDWLRRPAATRPRFVTLYFDTVDTAGHEYGPDAPQTDTAIRQVDGEIGRLVDGLAALDQPANLVIVADHGMAATSSDRTVALDTLAPATEYRVEEAGPYASLYPAPGEIATVERQLLGRHGHIECWHRQDIPARYHYGTNPRIPPIFCLADVGWLVVKTAPTRAETGGNHGYDNRAPEMAALFVANGPAFVAGKHLPPFDNVDVAPLLRDLIGLPADPRLDGDDAPFRHVLRPTD